MRSVAPEAVDRDPNAAFALRVTSAAQAADAWLVPEFATLPLSPQRCLVRNPLNGAALEVSSGEHAVLSACEGCLPFAQHVLRAAARLRAPAAHHAAMRELLERCARAGILLSVTELTARFGKPAGTAPVALGGAVIRTADRPRLLARLLKSAEELEARGSERRCWIVIDDSHDRAKEEQNRAAIAEARLDITHHDRAAAAGLQAKLLAEFPRAAREIEWLLAPGDTGEATPGRPLNHALLLLAGRAFVSFDDDAVIDARRPPLAGDGFAVSDGVDELTWYEGEESLLAHCPAAADLDPIAQHAQWLGLPMADAWARAETRSGSLAAMLIAAIDARRFAAGAHVIFTHSHTCGDPGSNPLPLQHFQLPAASREWLAAHPQAAAWAFAGRVNWRGHARLRFAPRWQFTLTTIAGLDNSRLLPPTTRGLRSQDLLLGALAHWMHPYAWQVDLPFALLHRREPARQWLGARDAVGPEPLRFIIGYLEHNEASCVSESPESRLAAAAALLADLAAASETRLAETIVGHEMDVASRLRFAIQAQLDDAALPAGWKRLLAPWLDSPALALDDAAVRSRAPAVTALRELLQRYAAALAIWPQLWQFCRESRR